jgi:peptidoglycan/xylan/chitin deacetylase (PgdA/CDA1 family)
LIYHRVNDEKDHFFPGIPTSVFARQMEYLASQWNVLALEEALERASRKDIPDNAIVITFDDGYRDNFVHAFPILRKLSLPATIFLVTGVIGTGRSLWHDRVFSAFRETHVPVLAGIPSENDRYDLQTLAGKLAAQSKVLRFIWSLGEDDRSRWIDRLVEELHVPDHRDASNVMLTWDEIRLMHGQGVGFGGHTVTHPILSKLPAYRAVEELQQSKAAIEHELRTTVNTFAYPIGRREDFSEDTKRFVREAGYVCALTTVPGTNTDQADPFELRRATPWDEDIAAFAFRLNYFKMAS